MQERADPEPDGEKRLTVREAMGICAQRTKERLRIAELRYGEAEREYEIARQEDDAMNAALKQIDSVYQRLSTTVPMKPKGG